MAKVTSNLFTFVYVCFQNSKGIQRFNKEICFAQSCTFLALF